MSDHIFSRASSPAEPIPTDTSKSGDGFTLGGQSVAASHNKCYAKTVRDSGSGRDKFFVKQEAVGHTRLYNPLEDESSVSSRRKTSGMDRFKWQKVSKECFDLYVTFLRTRNLQFLRRAERMLD